MDELFEAYLAVYEAFNEKGEFKREGDNTPPPASISPEELAKRRARNDANTQRGAERRALTASQTPEEKEAAAEKRKKLAAQILNTQNEEFIPLSPEKEKRVQNRVGELVRNLQVKGEKVKELRKKPFKRFRPKLRAQIVSIANSGKKDANLARNATDALIRTSVDRDASRQKKMEDLKKQLGDLEGRNNIRKFTREELEYIIDTLVYEGYADDYDGALFIMEAMSDEWVEEILGE